MHAPRLLVGISLFALVGAEDCPIGVQSGGPGPGSTAPAVDIGGTSGAIWDLSYDREVLVTLRTSTKVAAKQTSLTGPPLVLLDTTLDLGTFCWRADVVCPHQVLPAQTMLVQSSTAGAFVAGFNRRGPFTALAKEVGLPGTLDGKELTLPLAVGGAAEGYCGLGKTSTVLATASASASSGAGDRADQLTGRVTVAYSGTCLDLGGGAVAPDAMVELSVAFSGKRR